VSDKHIAQILTDKNVKNFLDTVFTHSSFDPINNYELDEFLGDGTVNECIVYYIRHRFPKIISVKWMTRIKHNLSSKKQLAHYASATGLDKYVRYGDEMEEIIAANPNLKSNIEYMSMLEDVMEAFCGHLILTIEGAGHSHGVAVQIVHNILYSFFDAEEISLKYEDVFDGITRLKELYESKAKGLRWPTGKVKVYRITKIGDEKKGEQVGYEVQVYGWPKGNKTPIDENRVVLATARASSDDVAKHEASVKALKVLETTYGIVEFKADPYQR